MRKIFIFAILLAALCSCSANKAADISIINTEYETEISSAQLEVLKISGLKNREFEDNINKTFAQDADGAAVSFDTMAADSTDKIRMGNKCVFEMKQMIKSNYADFISVIEEHYVYTGGAHGSLMRYPHNIDTFACKTLKLSDLFKETDFRTELNRQIDVILDGSKEEYSDLWEHPTVTSEDNFYISDKKLVIFYQPYELSYYARGFVEFPIKLTDIEGYLKDEYKRLI